MPADIETTTVPITTTGETRQQGVLCEGKRNAGLIVSLGSCKNERALWHYIKLLWIYLKWLWFLSLPCPSAPTIALCFSSSLLFTSTVATSPPSDSVCDFDHGLCGWTHDPNAPLYWSLHSHGESPHQSCRLCMTHCCCLVSTMIHSCFTELLFFCE